MGIVNYEIVEQIARIGKNGNWNLELNRVSWGDRPVKLDIRAWSEDYMKCSKGITLTEEEARALRYALEGIV